MIKRKLSPSYLALFVVIMALMSLPKSANDRLQGMTVGLIAPSWQHLLAVKNMIVHTTEIPSNTKDSNTEELQKLYLENTLLQTEIAHLKETLQYEMQILEQLKIQKLANPLIHRHRSDLKKILESQLQAIPARIIFRSPVSWNSSLWIDVGESTNKELKTTVIAKNSPVLVGNSIIGVVDFVGKNQARVRLITDSQLTPSVRALRDQTLLAKGEIHGAGKPLWRSQRQLLKGIGFNYDYADKEGPARDLRTGKPIDDPSTNTAIPILKNGDLLVTTGMDGVFPPNLLVAKVTNVHLLKEGDYFYELDAIPTAGNLDNLTLVFVLAPIGYDPQEQPLSTGW